MNQRNQVPSVLINIHLFVKLRHFRHYYHGAPDLFIAELMENQPKLHLIEWDIKFVAITVMINL